MDLGLTEIQQMLKTSAQEFLSPPHYRLAERVDLVGQPGDVPRAGLAMIDALGNRGVDLAHGLDQGLLRCTGIARCDGGTHTLHAGPHIGADVAVARGSLDRLAGSLFC